MAHLYGPIWGHTFLAWIETSDGLIAVDTGWDVAQGQPWEGSDLAALAEASERSGQPLTHILLTHDHPDHCLNLPHLLARWPEAAVYAHERSGAPQVTHRLRGGETLTLGGLTIRPLYTPGHSQQRDELCYHLPAHSFLFLGDVAQPQGPSYAFANGPSPIPFFHMGDDYHRSLERLIALEVAGGRTGHGDLLGPEQLKQWLRVTLATVQRIEALAIELVDRYPAKEEEWLAELLYDTIADERHFGTRAANQRKRHASYPGATDYQRFDLPGILWAIRAARATL